MIHAFQANLKFTLDAAAARSTVSQATSMFNNIRGRVDLQIAPGSLAQVQKLGASASELRSQLQALSAAAAPAASAIGRMTSSLTAAAAGSSVSTGLRSAAASTRAVGAAAQDATYSVQKFGRQSALAARRFAAFQTVAGTIGAVSRAMREGVAGAVAFDSGLNRLMQVSGETASQVRSVGDEIMRLSTGMGAVSADLMDAALTLKQAGFASKDVRVALEGIAQASLAPSFSSMRQVTEGAIAAFQQFGKSANNLKEQLGAINAVAADFAVEASDIVTTVQKLGGTASQAGASFNEMLAIFTSVRATTRESADSISTGLRTVLSRVQRSDTVESLRQLGIELRHTRAEAEAMGQTDMEGQFVGAYEAVRRLSEGLSKIRTTDPRFSAAIEDLGGYRQVSKVIPLIQQFGEAQRALNVARLGSASLEAAAATRQDALATKVAKTREEFQRLANDMVQTRGFRAMVDSVLTLASGLAQVLDVVKPLVPLMATLGTVKLAQGITQFGTGLYQGFTGSLGGARPVPRRFAIGGVVPGVGSGDTVPAQLEPGEFVIRKSSAQRIGYDTLYALNAQRYNQGGQVKARSVVTADNVRAIIREYEQKTGIKFSALASRVRMVDTLGAGDQNQAFGSFTRDARTVTLNRSTITTMAKLRETLAHEFGHALDLKLASGTTNRLLSESAGSITAKYGRREADLQRRYDREDGTAYSKRYSDYYYSRKEGFARTFASHLAGDPDEGLRSRFNRRGFTSLLDDAARATNADYKPSLWQRAKVGMSRFLRRFATGGGTGEKVDALLTPGEFIFSKEAAARMGPDALKRMNLYGDLPRFAAGGPVLRYATGGPGYDLNALIMRVMTQVAGGGRGADERMSGAGERIARAVATGRLPADPAQAEAFLLRAAGLGAKAADERERRYRTRERSGLVNQTTGAPVIDSAAAGANAGIPLSSAPPRGRGRESNAAVAERNAYQSREYQTLQAIQAGGLTGSAAEREFARRMAVQAAATPTITPSAMAVLAPRPVAQTAEPGVLRAAAGGGRPPTVPPVATGPAPDDGRQGSQSTYRGAYLLARRAGLDAYQSRAQAVLALDAGGYGQQAVAAYGTLGSRTNERRAQQASIEAERAAGRDPSVFARPPYPLAVAYKGTTRPVQAGTFGFAPERSYGPPVDTNGVARAAESQATLARLGMLARNPTTGAFPLYNRTDISPTAAPGIYGFAPPQAAGDRIPLASTGVPRDTYAVDQTRRYRAESVGFARNGFVGLNTTGAADLADARGYAGVRALGGPNLVSNQTALATQQAAHAKLEQELTRAIDRQLRALYPAITATEARRKAEEQAKLALEQNTAILRNSKGQVVGTAANAQQLQAAGMAPGGTGWFSGATVRQRAGSFFGNLGRSFTPAGGMAGTYGLMFGAPMLAEQIGPSQQRIQAAAVTGNTTGTMAQGAAGSALSTAAMGAGVGMVFGPWGAAIGAAAGGLVGLAQGISRTSREIRDAKVGQAVQNLGDMLTAAANNVRGGIGTVSPDNLRRELGALNSEAGERAREVTNRSWWNPMRGQTLSAMTSEEQAAVRTKENRAVFGGQAGAMVALLSREAEDLARKNPRTRAADLGGRLGADPAAGQLVNAVAATRGVPVNQVLREFTESIRVAQRRVRVEEDLRRGQVAAERSAGAMSRLADAVSNAANSVARFETSMTVLGSVFSGSGGTGRVTPVGTGFASLGAGTGAEFRRSAGVLGEALGADGSLFLRRSAAADQLSRALPSVLATLGNTPVGAAGLSGKAVRDLLHDQLLPGMDEAQRKAALKDNQPLGAAIESAVSGILRVQEDAKESGGLARRLQDDAGRVAQEVAEAFAGPLKEMGLRMARDIEENANRFVDGLASARQMLNTVGESLDRAAELRLGAARTAADVTADRTGRSATDLLSLRDLQAPFAERQQRLTGLGADAENPAAIAARLRQVTGDIAAATSARDNAVGSRDRFSVAAGSLDRLVGVSNNLQSALRNLASASERAAGLQEKLNAATLNRDSRLGYAEKYAMASPEEQARMQRGQQLIIGLDRGRTNFNELAPSEQQLALQSLNDFGQTRLASGRTAEGLKRQLLGGLPGVTDAGQENERRGLQDQIVGVFNTAEQAQRALAAFQQDTYTRFIADLKSLHEQFFARLSTNLAAEQLGAARNSLAAAGVDQAGQRQELLQRDALARIGVRDQAGLKNLQGGQADVTAFFAADARFRSLENAPAVGPGTRDALRGDLKGIADELRGGLFSAPKTEKLEEVLRTRGFDQLSPEGRSEAMRAVTERMRRFGENPEGRLAWSMMTPDQRLNTLDSAVRNAMGRGQWVTQGQAMDDRSRAARNLEARGVDVRALQGLNTADRSAVRSALTGTLNLDTLDARVKDTTDAISRFGDQVQRAEEALRRATGNEAGSGALAGAVGPAGVLRRADGGFTPRGTDTVPAMLTPGEFVINRASTQANLPLLREINAARGAVQYRQEGGSIRRPSLPTATQVAEGYLWSVKKINEGLSWLGFAEGGIVPFTPYGLDRVRSAAPRRGPLVGGGGGVIPTLDAAEANVRASRLRGAPGRRPTSVVDMTPAEALAVNRALNAQNMGFSQALARSGMDDGQVQAGLGSLAQRRDFENRVFMDKFGASTAAMRMRNTQGWAAGAGLRRATSAMPAATVEAARRIREAFARDAQRHSPSNRVVTMPGDRTNGSFNVGRYADGGFVGGSGTGDTVPAMLSPGEFIFSRPAVSALGAANLNRVHRFATGGIVPGGAAGGGPGASGMLGLSQEARTAMDQFAGHSKGLGVALTGFAAPAGLLASAFQNFNAGAEKLAGALEKFKGEVSHSFNGNIVVDVNGAEALNALKGELQTDLTSVVMRQVVDYVGQMFPDATKPQGVGPAGY